MTSSGDGIRAWVDDDIELTHVATLEDSRDGSALVLVVWGVVEETMFTMLTHFPCSPGKQLIHARFSWQHLQEMQRALGPLHSQHVEVYVLPT